jgi:hypothetical protein
MRIEKLLAEMAEAAADQIEMREELFDWLTAMDEDEAEELASFLAAPYFKNDEDRESTEERRRAS